MARSLFATAVLFIIVAATVSCSSQEGASVVATPAAETFVTTLTITAEDGRPSSSFRQGESIVFNVRVKNVSAEPRHVEFGSACQFGFLIRDEGSGRIVLDVPEACALVLTSLDFDPGEAKSFTFPWKQMDTSGKPVDRGSYEAQGRMLADIPGTVSDWGPFTID